MSSSETKAIYFYQIEKKSEDRFVGVPSDSRLPPLEAPTKQELQIKIQDTLTPFIQQIASEADRIEMQVVIRKHGGSSDSKILGLSKPVFGLIVLAALFMLFVFLYQHLSWS